MDLRDVEIREKALVKRNLEKLGIVS